MDTSVSQERLFLLKEQLTLDDAKEIAFRKKVDAFGAVNRVASFLSRPNDDDFEMTYSEHRFQPFWHIQGFSKYIFDRSTQYEWPVSASEVQAITLLGKKREVVNGKVAFEATDHCEIEEEVDWFVDGMTGQKQPDLKKYLESLAQEINKDHLNDLNKKKIIMVPPKVRASALVGEALSKMMKVVQADKFFEEKASIEQVDLYYHPVYAFEFHWLSKQKKAVVEVDGITKQVSFGKNVFKEYIGKALDRDFLFDLGADAAGMVLPGGSIAVKIAKKMIDRKNR